MRIKNHDVFGFGADMKSSFAAFSGGQFFISGPFGDLGESQNFMSYQAAVIEYLEKMTPAPRVFVRDLHPGYYSSNFARQAAGARPDCRLAGLQHHYAHALACMFDNGLEPPVIAVCFDGTGYGLDGAVWGGEFFIITEAADGSLVFERPYHLAYVDMQGGERAPLDCWRCAFSYLKKAFNKPLREIDSPLVSRIPPDVVCAADVLLEKKINTYRTSSAGRLFDAAASIAGVCDENRFDAQGPVELERAALKVTENSRYEFLIDGDEIDVCEVIRNMSADTVNGVRAAVISARFHNTIGGIIMDVCSRLYRQTGILRVCLSGGCFMNARIVNYLRTSGAGSPIKFYFHDKFSTTDSGISAGQVVFGMCYNNQN